MVNGICSFLLTSYLFVGTTFSKFHLGTFYFFLDIKLKQLLYLCTPWGTIF